jgi:hypothetical protein
MVARGVGACRCMLLMAQKSILLSRPAMIVHSISWSEDQWVNDVESIQGLGNAERKKCHHLAE